MSLIRGVLLAGKFRTQHELNGVSNDDQRNILIVELCGRTNQSVEHFQAMDDATLAGTGAVHVFVRETKIRTDAQLKTISDDDQRNLLIIEMGVQTHLPGNVLQGMSNMDLVLMGLGNDDSFIRGVMLAGKFRTQHDLNGMSHEDQRNTLIVELSGRTNQSGGHFQAMDDATLAGAGAVYLFLREARIRNEAQLKTISDDDQRNILIVELGAQTQLPGPVLQGMSNMELVTLGLGAIPLPTAKEKAWKDNIVTGGLAALGGYYEIIFYKNGNFVFQGHMHNSGMDNYDSQLAVAILDASGQPYTFEHRGKTYGTLTPGRRDDDWVNSGFNQTIADNWRQMQFAQLGRVFNYDSAIADATNNAVMQALNALIKAGIEAGVKAAIALV